MSNTASIANFYVDSNGNEQPIKYKAADLMNNRAPAGYHWERGNDAETHNEAVRNHIDNRIPYIYDVKIEDDYYICVKNREPIE